MQSVKVWEEGVIIPAYEIGKPDRNPMFLEKRVYQGTSGVVYPHPVIDKVYDKKEDKAYKGVFLENEYLKIMILPEIGGRIQMAYDKTNKYHFIYYNRVIKPALVGLSGPWISGGIEFNWPQHHRPSTFDPVDYGIHENEDGSKTVWVNEIENMFHTKGMAGFTLYPGKAYLEVKAQLYNRTPYPQTFLWWANPAVQVDEHYQSVFPPDVHAVYDHGRRDVSSFPIATGTYYKVDYSPGTDISRYQNIPVPMSYMAVNSQFDFVGGYHHQKRAGMLHVADHHISPGKKQWTWGSGEFGKMWDKQLTDNDGPYFEIMTGVYTDNQPDFSWIMPNEERSFKQYFLPYKEIGYVKNASKDAAVNLEAAGEKISVKVYVTAIQNDLHILLKNKAEILFIIKTDLSPKTFFEKELDAPKELEESDLLLEVLDSSNRLLISYRPVKHNKEDVPPPARPIPDNPEEIESIEELYLAGLHLEQYRHATFSPVKYYEEALRRDSSDIRCNNALGLWYFKHGQFLKAEPLFRKAIEKLIKHNPNPYDGEPYYNLGLCLTYLDKWEEAYDAFYKATWNAAWQDNAFLQLAYISCRKHDWEKGLEHVEQSLSRNYHGLKARHLKSIILRKLNRPEEAEPWIKATLAIDNFTFGSLNELCLILASSGKGEQAQKENKKLHSLIRGWEQSYIEIAIDYLHAGCYEEAAQWLLQIRDSSYPLVHYYLAFCYDKQNKRERSKIVLEKAFSLSADRVFPNRLEDVLLLQWAVKTNPKDYKAYYYLGNLWYDKRQYDEAITCWENSVSLHGHFQTAHRNLGIAYFNKRDNKEKAVKEYEMTFKEDSSDSRVLFELDQLYKMLNKPIQERLAFLSKYKNLIEERDDLYIEYVTLYNLSGNHSKALELLKKRKFHPWEGGEGKVSKQYVYALVKLARIALQKREADEAIRLLNEAQHYPENLGEGKLYGTQENNIFYWLGCAYDTVGQEKKSNYCWKKASEGLSEPQQALYYNDKDPSSIYYQGLALQKLGNGNEAKKRFQGLIDYGRKHLSDLVKTDFFAVSLPELSVFEIDLNKRNEVFCYYLMGLGYLGLGNEDEAELQFKKVSEIDVSHHNGI